MPLKRINTRLNELAETTALSNQDCINILAGTTGLEQQDAFNIWAGTTGLSRQAAANVKAGTTALSLQEALEIAEVGSGSITDPTDISGLQVWFDVDDSPAWSDNGTTPAANNDPLYRWDDISGNANRNLVQTTLTNRPTYASAGEAVVVFDGVDNFMTTNGFTLAQPYTVIIGFAPITHTAGDFFYDGVGGVADGGLNCTANANEVAMQAGGSAPVATLAFGDWNTVTCVYNGASSSIQVNNGSATVADTGSAAPNGLRLGANGGAAVLFGDMQVKFFLMYNSALSAANRTAVYDWAIAKFPILA